MTLSGGLEGLHQATGLSRRRPGHDQQKCACCTPRAHSAHVTTSCGTGTYFAERIPGDERTMVTAPNINPPAATNAEPENAMTAEEAERPTSDPATLTRDLQLHLTNVRRRVSRAISFARTSAAMIMERVPGTMLATRAGAHGTTSALQTLPDPTLRWLAATSVGLGAGFYLAGAPRLAIAAGIAPALLMGAAIVLRPIEPAVPMETNR